MIYQYEVKLEKEKLCKKCMQPVYGKCIAVIAGWPDRVCLFHFHEACGVIGEESALLSEGTLYEKEIHHE